MEIKLKQERAKNTHVVYFSYCGADNKLTEKTETCKYCRRQIESVIKLRGDNMPELPEVETVKETLKKIVLNKRINKAIVLYSNIIDTPALDEFLDQIKNQTIHNIQRKGKWLMFELDEYYLLSHLRMEGKYIMRNHGEPYEKHEHVVFELNDGTELRYKDTRKFGKMHLIKKEELNSCKALSNVGLEPFDKNLTSKYLLDKYKTKKLPIKTVLLDQSIIAGIGNIYADEILFLCKLNPLKKTSEITDKEANKIIKYTKEVLEKAISSGGTTIRSYESSEGVHGRFQQELLVHNRQHEKCSKCKTEIIKITVGGRGTYYCPKCQK